MAMRGRPPRQRYFQQFAAALEDITRCGGLPTPNEARDIWTDLWHREVHHSTAIEGNTLVLNEVATLLDTGRAVGAKQHAEYLEVVGYGRAASWVYENSRKNSDPTRQELITVTEVREAHHRAMKDVWAVYPHPDALPGEEPGNYRLHDIHAFEGGMTPPSHVQVASDMDLWARQVRDFGDRMGAKEIPVEQIPYELARIHQRFEAIHPFIDGNGRAGRLALNLILVRLSWPPAIIYKSDRAKYLDALDHSDKGDDGPLAELLARSVVASTHHLLKDIAGPAKTVPLATLADEELALPALKQAAVRGRLDAHRGSDGVWRSTRKAVEAYKARRYSRR
ncbi:MAG: Fic family protein [Actinobacteria bacterium HGW-Actinobacteria-8]|nr:MAG: Fic family protein [Actinobacteria bacterium HGW-Actinobacteria-8]